MGNNRLGGLNKLDRSPDGGPKLLTGGQPAGGGGAGALMGGAGGDAPVSRPSGGGLLNKNGCEAAAAANAAPGKLG